MREDRLIVGMPAQQKGYMVRRGGIKIGLRIADHQAFVGALPPLGNDFAQGRRFAGGCAKNRRETRGKIRRGQDQFQLRLGRCGNKHEGLTMRISAQVFLCARNPGRINNALKDQLPKSIAIIGDELFGRRNTRPAQVQGNLLKARHAAVGYVVRLNTADYLRITILKQATKSLCFNVDGFLDDAVKIPEEKASNR